MTYLGIDLGTGSVKAALVDGEVVAKQSQTYEVTSLQPGWAESDPAEWLAATRSVVSRLSGAQPVGVGFSGQMHGVVVVDADLNPLRPAILWADARSTAQAQRLAADIGSAELSRLGSPAVPGFAASSIAWLLENEPEVMKRAAMVLQPKDWLRAALGAAAATDPSDASGTLLYDVVAGQWSPRVVDWLGITPSILPPVLSSTEPVGQVELPEFGSVPCVVGAADTACALAGLGLGDGEGFIAVGSGSQVVRVMDHPTLDESLRTHTFAAAGPQGRAWYRIGAVQSAGLTLTAALRWFDATTDEAAAALADGGVRASDPIFVPYLSGERTPFMNAGLRGEWHGMSLATDRAAMLRSILEGVAQAVALSVEAVQASGDRMPDIVPLVGGGTHDPAFRRLIASAARISLGVTDAPDAAVVGAALLGAGECRNPRGVTVVDVVDPDPKAVDLLAARREIMVSNVRAQEA